METANDVKRIADLLESMDLAFPGACEVELGSTDRFSFKLRITNILKSSVDNLVIPRLSPKEVAEHAYDKKKEIALFRFTFSPVYWKEVLPFAFLDMNVKSDELTAARLGALLRALYTGTINAQEYQVWIDEILLGNKNED
jgi:hypothetical protein